MRYFFVFLAITAVWVAVIAIAALIPSARGISLYFSAQVLTVFMFFIGFYKK